MVATTEEQRGRGRERGREEGRGVIVVFDVSNEEAFVSFAIVEVELEVEVEFESLLYSAMISRRNP